MIIVQTTIAACNFHLWRRPYILLPYVPTVRTCKPCWRSLQTNSSWPIVNKIINAPNVLAVWFSVENSLCTLGFFVIDRESIQTMADHCDGIRGSQWDAWAIELRSFYSVAYYTHVQNNFALSLFLRCKNDVVHCAKLGDWIGSRPVIRRWYCNCRYVKCNRPTVDRFRLGSRKYTPDRR